MLMDERMCATSKDALGFAGRFWTGYVMECLETNNSFMIISRYTNNDDIILDMFSGTASMLIAAIDLDRKAIAFEIDEATFKR